MGTRTLAKSPEPEPQFQEPTLPATPLPRFAVPKGQFQPAAQDQGLPWKNPEPSPSPSSPSPQPDPDRLDDGRRAVGAPTLTPGSSGAGSRWWRPGGEATETAKVLAGLMLAVTGLAALLARRSGREFRKPTKVQADDIAAPIARIAVRHLPMDLLGPDLMDAGIASSAIAGYLFDDGPLVQRWAGDPDTIPYRPEDMTT
jgi:hypothetical protein